MTEHTLKIWPAFFAEVASGIKTFEVRRSDRHFRAGDHLHLREWEPEQAVYTGSVADVVVTYVSDLETIGIPGFVAMSIRLGMVSIELHRADPALVKLTGEPL